MVIVMGSPLWLRTYLATGFLALLTMPGLDSSCGAGLKSDQKWVVSVVSMPLLHQWAYLAMPVILVALRVHAGSDDDYTSQYRES